MARSTKRTVKVPAADPARTPPVKPYERTEADQRDLDTFVKRRTEGRISPGLVYEERPDGRKQAALGHPDKAVGVAQAANTFGVSNIELTAHLLDECIMAFAPRNRAPNEQEMSAALAAVAGIAPNDEAEAMLAVQMVTTHHAATTMLQRAMCQDRVDLAESAGNLAIKLLRTYAAQLEALSRYRGKGQQKVIVEHVHVHQGGQAIVGHVETGGRGVSQETGEQAHEPRQALAYEPGSPLSCQDTAGNVVPIAAREG